MYRTSQEGINLIKKWEGCKLKAYKCPAGVWTIGYGHTGADVREGVSWTQKQADDALTADLRKFESYVDYYVDKYNLSQNQYDALVSFSYNLGPGNLNKLLSNGTKPIAQVAKDILLYINSNGKPLAGLRRRREAEYALFIRCGVDMSEAQEYYMRYRGTSNRIDEVLADIGADEDYLPNKSLPRWMRRLPIANANGCPLYNGTAAQNLNLIQLAKEGILKMPQK